MNTLILCAALLLLGTKALDCLTTLRAVLVPEAESNPIARSMMNRLRVRRTTALVFVIATIWTCALTAVALATESALVGAVFVAAGIFVALVEVADAVIPDQACRPGRQWEQMPCEHHSSLRVPITRS